MTFVVPDLDEKVSAEAFIVALRSDYANGRITLERFEEKVMYYLRRDDTPEGVEAVKIRRPAAVLSGRSA